MALTTFVPGDVLEAQQLNDSFAFVQASYTSYTPTVTGWTLGNGTFPVSVYSSQGKMVNAQGHFSFGSTSAVGATILIMTLPVGAVSASNAQIYGVCTFFDVSAQVIVSGNCRIINDTQMQFYWNDPEAAPIATRLEPWSTGVTLPFTFATGDIVSWNIMYQRS